MLQPIRNKSLFKNINNNGYFINNFQYIRNFTIEGLRVDFTQR